MSGDTPWTPAPWEACEPGDYSDFDGDSRVVCGDDMRIAVVHWHDGHMRAMNDANARLIAAAPEMAEALRGLCESMEEAGVQPCVGSMNPHERALGDALALLAKIGGQS